MEYRTLKEIPKIKILGRIQDNRETLPLFSALSGLEMNFVGSDLYIDFDCDYKTIEPWIVVEVDDAIMTRMPLQRGRNEVLIVRGLEKDCDGHEVATDDDGKITGTVKHIRVLRDVQAMPEDESSHLIVRGVRYKGGFEKIEEPKYRLEFLGDSITSGEGAIGSQGDKEWVPLYFSATRTYEVTAAKELNAEIRVFSQSGWGIVSGWDNDPRHNIPENYTKVCGSLKGTENIKLGAQDEYDFSSWVPDAIIINLGTNDSGAFNSPEFKVTETGQTFKERQDENGVRNKEDLARFEKKCCEFLSLVREKNPTSKIVWAYGMCGDEMEKEIKEAIENRKKSGDKNVFYFAFPDTPDELLGARQHPGARAHEICGKKLADYLKSIL